MLHGNIVSPAIHHRSQAKLAWPFHHPGGFDHSDVHLLHLSLSSSQQAGCGTQTLTDIPAMHVIASCLSKMSGFPEFAKCNHSRLLSDELI